MTPAQVRDVLARARCLFNEEQVEAALDRMAGQIVARVDGRELLLITILHGGVVVAGRLATRLSMPLQMDYLHATRYRGNTQGADLQWRSLPTQSLAGRHVLLLDDILDEGATLAGVKSYCREQGCAELLTAVLIDKRHSRKAAGSEADFVGLTAEDSYLFGYGMDYRGYLRNAPGIFAVDPADL